MPIELAADIAGCDRRRCDDSIGSGDIVRQSNLDVDSHEGRFYWRIVDAISARTSRYSASYGTEKQQRSRNHDERNWRLRL